MSIAKVLVIAKDHWIALDLKYRLQRLGYKTTTAISAVSDLNQVIKTSQPEIVLLDRQIISSTTIGAIEAADLPILCFNAENQPCDLSIDLPCLSDPTEDTILETAIREALRQHRTQTELAQQLEDNQRQIELFRTVDHELRTPLSTMLITLEWIELIEQEELSARSLQKLDHLTIARNSVVQMAEFLDRTSLLYRCKSGKLPRKPIALHLPIFCQTLIAEIYNCSEITIEIISKLPDPIVKFDELIVRHILVNLLNNAVKYSNANSTVSLSLSCNSSQLILQIQDQGIGIPERDRTEIFTPLYRGSNVSTIPGTGMGLAIVQQLVSACQGQITVESSPAIGSTFTVMLPLQT